jgi:hypothetical protein
MQNAGTIFMRVGTKFNGHEGLRRGSFFVNRACHCRIRKEATAAAVSVFGAKRVGVRLAPSGPCGDMFDSDPERTFGSVAE